MSNHICASHVDFIKVVYTNNVITYVPLFSYNSGYARMQLEDAVTKYRERLEKEIEHYKKLDVPFEEYKDDLSRVTSAIDFACNYNLDCSQLFCHVPSFMVADIFYVGYPYDLGENEEADDIMFTFDSKTYAGQDLIVSEKTDLWFTKISDWEELKKGGK